MSRYPFQETEAKWQRTWEEQGTFAARLEPGRPKYYVLEMFPYPSGRIHMGHVRNYTLGDVVARYKRAQGFGVLHPMGWDAFGLPAENAAMAKGVHPAEWTYANIAEMRAQFQSMGLSLDWSREIATCDPAYYRHEQAMFLDFLDAGLVYRKESWVNWDPVDQTVLANEQVIDGRGWRSGAVVERRKLAQWFFKITEYTEELLDALVDPRSLAAQGAADAGALDRAVGGRARPVPDRGPRRTRSRCSPLGPTPCSARASWRWRPIIRSPPSWPPRIPASPHSLPSAPGPQPARRRSSRPRRSAMTPGCAAATRWSRSRSCRSTSPISC